jgi:uncharacterized protein YbjT (DUF2867 family)
MNVLVTGATGIIGRQAIPRLREAGHEVAGMARSAAAAGWLRPTSRPALGCWGPSASSSPSATAWSRAASACLASR